MSPPLRGRAQEQEALDRLLLDVRRGHSRLLVLRGESGVGKTALLICLAFAPRRAASCHLDQLSTAQRAAPATAQGLSDAECPGQLLTGLAVLGLFAETPLQSRWSVSWTTRSGSTDFRGGPRVRRPPPPSPGYGPSDAGILAGLPELRVDGLCDDDARTLLDSVLPRPAHPRLRDVIVAEARGNPALLELCRAVRAI